MIETTLKKVGLCDKEIKTYIELLKSGQSSARKLSEKTRIDRTTTSLILKNLISKDLVGFSKKGKRKFYKAEPPENITRLIKIQEQKILSAQEDIKAIIPELKSFYDASEGKPIAKYYEGDFGARKILEELLGSAKKDDGKKCRIYSCSDVNSALKRTYPNWAEEMKKEGIEIFSISIGKREKFPWFENEKQISENPKSSCEIIICSDKFAQISINDKGDLQSMILKDKNATYIMKILFDSLWEKTK